MVERPAGIKVKKRIRHRNCLLRLSFALILVLMCTFGCGKNKHTDLKEENKENTTENTDIQQDKQHETDWEVDATQDNNDTVKTDSTSELKIEDDSVINNSTDINDDDFTGSQDNQEELSTDNKDNNDNNDNNENEPQPNLETGWGPIS